MNSLSLYAVHGEAVPVWMHRELHKPMPVGAIDVNYSNFKAGQPDPSAFDVPGINTCTRGDDSQCRSALALARRHTLAHLGHVLMAGQ